MASISPPTTRGPQNPSKYPRTGATYAYYGEQPGFVYNPWTDRYVVDPNAQREYEEQQGIREKEQKPPSAAGQLATTIGGLAAGTAATGLTAYGIQQLLASGGTAATTGTAATAGTGAGLVGSGAGAAGTGGGSALSGGALAGNGLYTPAATNMSVGGSAAPTATSAGMLGSVVPIAGAALGTYLAGKSALNTLKGKDDKSIGGLIGRGTLGIATGGISEIARPFLMRPSTRDIAKKHTKELQSVAPEDQNYQNYVAGMREQFNSAPPDPSKPFAGKYASWDDYKKGGLEAPDLTGVYGNIKTYGPKWAGLTQDQRVAVTQLNINDNLYNSKKGEVEITDSDKALANLTKVVAGSGLIGTNGKGPLPANPNAAASAVSGGLLPQRTGTSPGFDKNGKRITYGKS